MRGGAACAGQQRAGVGTAPATGFGRGDRGALAAGRGRSDSVGVAHAITAPMAATALAALEQGLELRCPMRVGVLGQDPAVRRPPDRHRRVGIEAVKMRGHLVAAGRDEHFGAGLEKALDALPGVRHQARGRARASKTRVAGEKP
jgi:hypothetical protein